MTGLPGSEPLRHGLSKGNIAEVALKNNSQGLGAAA